MQTGWNRLGLSIQMQPAHATSNKTLLSPARSTLPRTDLEGTSDEIMFARSIIIENVRPQIDGSPLSHQAHHRRIHDALHAVLRHGAATQLVWQEVPMQFEENDRWRDGFQVSQEGIHFYTLRAWIDRFGSWARTSGSGNELYSWPSLLNVESPLLCA
jgi:hypothetical protein